MTAIYCTKRLALAPSVGCCTSLWLAGRPISTRERSGLARRGWSSAEETHGPTALHQRQVVLGAPSHLSLLRCRLPPESRTRLLAAAVRSTEDGFSQNISCCQAKD